MDDESRYKWPMMIQKERNYTSLNWGHADAALIGDSSWEEQAFLEDIGGVWPPRSYTCSFCRREFRSAQALGGHMNVHRRDRAKLKQQQQQQQNNINIHSITNSNNNQILDTPRHLLLQNPNIHHHHEMICSSSSNTSSNFDLDAALFSQTRPSSASMILIPPAPAPAAFTCSFSTTAQQHLQNISSCSKFVPPSTQRLLHHIQDSGNNYQLLQDTAAGCTTTTKLVESTDDDSKKKININQEEELQQVEVHFGTRGNYKLSSSSLVRKRPSCSFLHDEELEEDEDGLIILKKRQRLMDDGAQCYLFPNSNCLEVINYNKLGGTAHEEEEVEAPSAERSPNSTLEISLDLELRLGT